MEFVDEMEFDRLGVFTYSPEEDTPADSYAEGQVDEEVKEAQTVTRVDGTYSRKFPSIKENDRIGQEVSGYD